MNNGVLIHFHDIFFPYDYPKIWVYDNQWFWNEQYVLYILLKSDKYKAIFGSNMIYTKFKRLTKWKDYNLNGGSFYIKKILKENYDMEKELNILLEEDNKMNRNI